MTAKQPSFGSAANILASVALYAMTAQLWLLDKIFADAMNICVPLPPLQVAALVLSSLAIVLLSAWVLKTTRNVWVVIVPVLSVGFVLCMTFLPQDVMRSLHPCTFCETPAQGEVR